jgi:lysophospholipase L1-like esterase
MRLAAADCPRLVPLRRANAARAFSNPMFSVPCFSASVGRAGGALCFAIFFGLPFALGAAEATSFKFDFGPGAAAPGYVAVLPDMLFSAERGFGFEPGAAVTGLDRGGDALHGDFITSEKPFLFSVVAPEGNYRVTVTFGDAAGESTTTVKAESRRLMLEKVRTAAGKFETRSFIVNVRNSKVPPPPLNAPGNDHVELNNRENGPNGLVPDWDDKLTLEFGNTRPCVCALEIERAENIPTVFVVGDSTVTDQPREPGASWGQMLPRFFKPEVAVANHAESGETLKSFITELRFDKVLSQMKAGDYFFIQFGHNDEKASWPQTYVEAATTYKAYLKVFVAEAKRRGATPVLISSMQRRTFDTNGKIRNSHGDYPDAVREVAKEENVAFIDLSAMSIAFYEALGPAKAPLAFSGFGEKRDPTHHDNYGAYELAKCVVEGIRDNHLELAKFIVDDFTGFDPAHPDSPDTFDLPASPGRSLCVDPSSKAFAHPRWNREVSRGCPRADRVRQL